MKSSISLIVAYSRNRCIGKDGDMPWKLPADLAYFKKTTMACPIIMGRKTRDSLGRALPGRLNIAISRDSSYAADKTAVASSLEHAFSLAQAENSEQIFIIGGGQIYQMALAQADTIYATEIHADVDGDTYFPALAPDQWLEISREKQPEQNGLTFDFVVYKKT